MLVVNTCSSFVSGPARSTEGVGPLWQNQHKCHGDEPPLCRLCFHQW